MKPLCDYHVHTTFSDGKNTPEEMVLFAIEKKMSALGFSDHSYTFFDTRYCMQKEKIADYKREIARLKEKYKDKIEISCGIEQDYYSKISASDYDYAIGSVHFVKKGDNYLEIDESEEILEKGANEYFGGDYYSFAEEYFNTVANFANVSEIKIIGHFDLITKFNEGGKLFDESNPRYVAAWKTCADNLLVAKKVFEINTGAISRGYRKEAYPSKAIREYIKENGGKFILASDSHVKETLCFGFEKYTD